VLVAAAAALCTTASYACRAIICSCNLITCSMLRVVYSGGRGEFGKGNEDCEGGRSIRGQDIKTSKVEKAVLPSLSLLYSDNNKISIYDSRLSFYPTYIFYQLLLLLTTNAR